MQGELGKQAFRSGVERFGRDDSTSLVCQVVTVDDLHLRYYWATRTCEHQAWFIDIHAFSHRRTDGRTRETPPWDISHGKLSNAGHSTDFPAQSSSHRDERALGKSHAYV